MFETQDNAEVVLPTFFNDSGIRSWWYVQKRLLTPWFYVAYKEKYDDHGEPIFANNIIFFSLYNHLIEFAREKDVYIDEVYIVTPAHLNGTGKWRMDKLKEIWEGEEPTNTNQKSTIFVLNDNTVYVDSYLDTPEDRLLETRKIIEFI